MAVPKKIISEKIISENNLADQSNLESIILKTADDIRYLLKRINQKHSLLSIMIKASDEYYGSTLIEINSDENYLVIDELYPEEGHAKIEVGTQLSFDTQYSGAFVHFNGEIEAIGENEKAAYYKIRMPEKVEYHQRRNTYRIATSINNPVPVNLVNQQEAMIKAELRDLSHGGLCLRMNNSPHISINSGDYIPTCLIEVDEKRKILCSLNICHVKEVKETGSLRIGAQFETMSKIDRRELEGLIATLEREIIKKIKRTNVNSS